MGDRRGESALESAAEALRAVLAGLVNDTLTREPDPVTRLEVALSGLLGLIESSPDTVEVLTAPDATTPGVSRVRSMLENFLAALVEDGQREGSIADGPADEITRLLLAGVSDVLTRWHQAGSPPGLVARGERLFRLWLTGAGGADRAGAAAPEPVPTADPPEGPTLRELDVRPSLAAGVDPLADIRGTIESLAPGSLVHITAPFRPVPLETFLTTAGHIVDVAPLGPDAWSVAVVVGGGCEIVDLRDLEPPEPMEAVLTATVRGGPYAARMPRNPRLLPPHLEQRGVRWRLLDLEDGTALLWVAP